MEFHPLAQELNTTLQTENPTAFSLLSRHGKQFFFPSAGIIGQSAEAAGKRYNATIGIALEEDGTPVCLPSLAKQFALAPKDVFPYASTFGDPALRRKWLEHMHERNPSFKGEVSLPLVTAGLTHALDITGFLFVEEGDAIIIPDKFWDNYRLIFEANRMGKLTCINTFRGNGFDVQALKEALAAGPVGKRIVLLNFPNNPCGYTPTKEEMQEIAALLLRSAQEGNAIVVIIDDAYFGLRYEENVAEESLFAAIADLHERILAVKIDGASKEDYAWGLRVGFITFGMKGLTEKGLQALEHKAAGALRGTVSNVCRSSQSALLALHSSNTYRAEKEEKLSLLRTRHAEVKRVLQDEKYSECFTPYPFNSGYFMCVQLAKGIDAEKVRLLLLGKYDTGVISIGTMLRIAYSSLPTKDIQTVFDSIFDACLAVRNKGPA